METKFENDRVCFEKTCATIQLSAMAEVSPLIESLDLNHLEENKRQGRVYLEIEKTVNKMDILNRYQYIHYYKDIHSLFNIFECAHRLNNMEEMENLKQAIILKENYNCLLDIKMEMDIRQHVAEFFARNELELPASTFIAGGTLAPPYKQDKSKLTKGVTLEQKLIIITKQLEERIGIFMDPSSIRQFVRWILYPNANADEPKMYIRCKSNEFKCMMYHFRHFNKKLSYAEIGRLGIFISKNGTIFSEGNLRSTSFEKLNTRHAIANIFAPYL